MYRVCDACAGTIPCTVNIVLYNYVVLNNTYYTTTINKYEVVSIVLIHWIKHENRWELALLTNITSYRIRPFKLATMWDTSPVVHGAQESRCYETGIVPAWCHTVTTSLLQVCEVKRVAIRLSRGVVKLKDSSTSDIARSAPATNSIDQ